MNEDTSDIRAISALQVQVDYLQERLETLEKAVGEIKKVPYEYD